MSVSKLCEALVEQEAKNKDQKLKNKDQQGKSKAQEKRNNEQGDASDAKLEIEVFTTTANGKQELKVKANESTAVDGVKVTYFKRITKDHTHYSPNLFSTLKKTISNKQHEPTVIHIHSWWNTVSVFSCWIAKSANVPVVLSPRGMITNYTLGNRNSFIKHIIHHLIGKRLLNYCHIHATSEQEKRDIEGIIKPKSMSVIPNFVRYPEKQPYRAFTTKKELRIISLSRIEEKKGLDILFEALAMINISWKLTIAGSGSSDYSNELLMLANNLGINDKIDWKGHVTDADKFELLSQHDLMVLASHNENFANTVIESLSVGTPVLISEHVGLSDYVLNNKIGWVSKLDSESFADILLKINDNEAQRLQIAQTAPSIIRKDFHLEKIVGQYLDLYKYATEHG